MTSSCQTGAPSPGAVHPRRVGGHRSDRIHAQRTAPERASCPRSTTVGTSVAEWYAAYGTLPRRTAGMPTLSNDTWSLALLTHTLVAATGTAARRIASAREVSAPATWHTGTAAAHTPTRSRATMPRTARRSDAPSPATKCREPNAYSVPLPPRASSAPNATNRTGSAPGCWRVIRATSAMTMSPDALSSAPGDCGTVSRCAPTTTCGCVGSKPGGSATTSTVVPPGTRTPHDTPAGTATGWRVTR